MSWDMKTRLEATERHLNDLLALKAGTYTVDELIMCAEENITHCKLELRKSEILDRTAEEMTAEQLRTGQ